MRRFEPRCLKFACKLNNEARVVGFRPFGLYGVMQGPRVTASESVRVNQGYLVTAIR